MNLRLPLGMEQKRRLMVISIVFASIAIHTPLQRLEYLNLHIPHVNLIRSILFFLPVGYLLFLVAKPVFRFLSESVREYSYSRLVWNSAAIFGLTSLLVFPATLGIMGVGYAQMSIAPFSFLDMSDQLYQRLLMPAFAFALHLRGPVFYHLFSLLTAFLGIMLVQMFFLKRKITLTVLEYVSIATSGFLITQFQSPGYTEALSYVFILLLLIVELGEMERVALFALSLFAHEGSMLIALAISVVLFSRREIYWIITLSALYGFIWLASFGFDLHKLLEVRSVGNYSTLEWIFNHPLREALGIFFSFKALWFLMFVAFYKMKGERINLLAYLIPGILLSFLAVDTSRMVGFSFVALLFSIYYIKQNSLLTDRQFSFVSIVNLCIPALYVGVNAGVFYFDGLYQLLQYGIFLR